MNHSPQEKARPRSPRIVRLVCVLSFFLLYFPFLTLITTSFIHRTPETSVWTLQWYVEALSDAGLAAALWESLVVGFWATLVSTIIGTWAALALHRYDFFGKRLLETLILVPLVMPCVVMGLSLLIWFSFLQITLGTFSIILAHITFSASFVVLTVTARLSEYDESLEAAARDLGATPLQVFRRITLPLLWPGILSGALMAFTLSFDDYIVTAFTSGVTAETLPMKIYSMIRFGISPKINALSTLLLFGTMITVLLIFPPWSRKSKIRIH